MTRTRFHLHGQTITFDDGGMNLLSGEALRELHEIIRPLATGDQRLIVFRSGRPNVFAAGADMAEMQRFTALEADAFSRAGQELFDAIARLPMLTIAAIDGDCFGGALDLAMAFDLRFATPRSRFTHPGARLGIITGFGGTTRWRDIVSPAVARRLFLGNEVFSSSAALEAGLVDVIDESGPNLQTLTTLDPGMIRALKELIRHSRNLSQQQLVDVATLLERLYARS
ncbi:MAG: enoyl-CoA hydratase/isomerase family protein [Thermoanaerobaculia bacterium]